MEITAEADGPSSRGPDRVVLYNEAYVAIASHKHPLMMGQTIVQAWGEILPSLEDSFATAEREGQAVSMDDNQLFLQRHGYVEETFFSYSLIPIRDEQGQTRGYYCAGWETTRQKLWERRTSTWAKPGLELVYRKPR